MIVITCKLLHVNKGMRSISFEFHGVDKQVCIDTVEEEMERMGFYSYQLSVLSE